jgi:Tol biopolymer transport system component
VTGDPIPLIDGIDSRSWWVSESGALLYEPLSDRVTAGSRLVLADAEGSILDTLPLPEEELLGLDVSPDGRYLAFATSGGAAREPSLMVYDLLRQDGPRRISDEIVALAWFAWSPNSDSLAYTAIDAGNPDVFVRPGAGGARRVLRSGPQALYVSDWLPDGRVAGRVEVGSDDRGDLILMPPDPDAPMEVFLDTPMEERDLRISPDGRWATYTSVDQGTPLVQLRTFPEGLDPRTIGVGEFPRWSADGTRLYFVRGVSGSVDDTLKVVTLGPGTESSPPRALLAFDHWGFDPLPDGGLVIAVGTSPERLAEVTGAGRVRTRTLVLDWLPSVRDRLGN